MSFNNWLDGKLQNDLKSLYDEDQRERNEYKNYLNQYDNWKSAAKAWIKDKKRSPDDVFNDKERLKQAKQLISTNIDQIVNSKKLKDIAWLLVQHMDNDVQFQKWFLQHLSTRTKNYRYLSDRIATNSGLPQKYGTQQD